MLDIGHCVCYLPRFLKVCGWIFIQFEADVSPEKEPLDFVVGPHNWRLYISFVIFAVVSGAETMEDISAVLISFCVACGSVRL